MKMVELSFARHDGVVMGGQTACSARRIPLARCLLHKATAAPSMQRRFACSISNTDPLLGECGVRHRALLHSSERMQIRPLGISVHAAITTDFGVPSFVIRLSALTAIIASLVCAPSFFARSLSPMMRLYRDIPFSARAC